MKLGSPPLPVEPTYQEVADWAELVALQKGKLTRGKLGTEVDRIGGQPVLIADAWRELEARAALAKDHWTFTLSATEIARKSGNGADYALPAFLAALGLRENIENSHRQLFEQCVSELVRALLPNSMRIGFPRRPPVPIPFRDALAAYAAAIHEKVRAEPPSSDNDLKMDVVAWRVFGDGRGGYLHLIGQCATGADWVDKLDELNLSVIAEHLAWGVEPLRFFATPHVIGAQEMRRVSLRAGLVLDRPRLLELAQTAPLAAPTTQEVLNALMGLY